MPVLILQVNYGFHQRLYLGSTQNTIWIGHILRRSYLLKHIIEGEIEGRMEVARRKGRGSKQLLDDLKDERGYWNLKGKALDRTLWRTRVGSGHGLHLRQITE
jgi:hypothetical protein